MIALMFLSLQNMFLNLSPSGNFCDGVFCSDVVFVGAVDLWTRLTRLKFAFCEERFSHTYSINVKVIIITE